MPISSFGITHSKYILLCSEVIYFIFFLNFIQQVLLSICHMPGVFKEWSSGGQQDRQHAHSGNLHQRDLQMPARNHFGSLNLFCLRLKISFFSGVWAFWSALAFQREETEVPSTPERALPCPVGAAESVLSPWTWCSVSVQPRAGGVYCGLLVWAPSSDCG